MDEMHNNMDTMHRKMDVMTEYMRTLAEANQATQQPSFHQPPPPPPFPPQPPAQPPDNTAPCPFSPADLQHQYQGTSLPTQPQQFYQPFVPFIPRQPGMQPCYDPNQWQQPHPAWTSSPIVNPVPQNDNPAPAPPEASGIQRTAKSRKSQRVVTDSSDESDKSDEESENDMPNERRYNSNSMPKLDTYHGDPAKWSVFLFQFKEIARISRWSERVRFEKLMGLLRDKAIEFVSKRPKSERRDYYSLLKTLKRRYGQVDSAATYRKTLNSIKQSDDEDLDTFSERIEELVRCSFPSMDDSAVDELAIDYFLQGCKDKSAAFLVLNEKPRSLPKALHLMKIMMQNQKMLGKQSYLARAVTFQDDKGKDLVNSVVEALKVAFPHFSEPDTKAQLVKRQECFSCGKQGHFSRECPQQRRSPSPSPVRRSRCEHCQGSGYSSGTLSSSPRRSPLRPSFTASSLSPSVPSTRSPSPKRVIRTTFNASSDSSLAIPVKLQSSEPIFAVVDTAAQVTVISEELYRQLQVQCVSREPIILDNAKKNTTMEGFVVPDVHMRIGEAEFVLDVVVAPINDKMLLGYDFLKKHHAKIDLDGRELTLDGKVVQMKLISSQNNGSSICRVHLLKRTVVPPNTVLYVGVKLDPYTKKEVIVEPDNSNGGLLMGAGVVKGEDAVVSFINDTDKHISLPRGHNCGVAVELDAVLPEKCDTQAEFSVRAIHEKADKTEKSLEDLLKCLPDHLKPVYDDVTCTLSDEERFQLVQLLLKHSNVFAKHEFDLGYFEPLKHTISLKDEQPFRDRMRRTPLCFQGEEEKTLQRMLDTGVIRPSSSEWASAPVLIRKKDGSVRYCIDYRRLNSKSVKDAFPLPRIEDCLDALSGSCFFSSLDMASGYWQIPMSEEDAPKTAFLTRFGLFEHVRMPFGLCNAPATFARAMGLVLRNLAYKEVLAYLDDVVVIGKNFCDHLQNLDTVLQRFGNYTLKLKPKKCHLFQTSIDFLGHRVSAEGIGVQEEKIKTVIEWPVPSTKENLISFLGTVNYHRRFIKDYALISRPLYNAYHAKQKLEWNDELQVAFDKLKQLLTNPPVLAYPNDSDTFILDCDASNVSIGAELLQCQTGGEKVISYASYSLTPAQRKYCTTRKELLALVTFVRHFRHYLIGRHFVVRTDHASLTWLMRFKHLEGQLARWMEELSQYDMQILHRSGSEHTNADGLSRIPDSLPFCDCYEAGKSVDTLPCKGCAFCKRCHSQWAKFEQDVDDVVPIAIREVQHNTSQNEEYVFENYTPAELRDLQLEDRDISPVIKWLEDDFCAQAELFRASAATKYLWNCKSQLELRLGVLYYRWDDTVLNTSKLKLVVPYKMRKQAISSLHDTKVGGHLGRDKTLSRVKDSFIWYGLSEDVRVYVEACAICLQNKKPNRARRTELETYQAGFPLERVHIDILGPFVESRKGNRYVLMIVDQFTKWVCCIPVPDQSAETTAESFYDHFVTIFGCPLQIHTDQGRNFESNYFKALCDLFQIVKTRTTPYRPSSNGQVERFNRVVLQYIRCFLEGKQAEWDLHLTSLGMSLRSMVNQSTGFTPNLLMFGREITLPVDLVYGLHTVNAAATSPPHFLEQKSQILHEAFASVRKNLAAAHGRQKRLYDTKLNHRAYSVGDVVYKLDNSSKIGQSKKLLPIFTGPYLVTRVRSPALYMIEDRKRSFLAHHDKLVLSKGSDFPQWLIRKRHDLLKDFDNEGPVSDEEQVESNVSESEDEQPKCSTTRSGRHVRLPGRYADFSME